MWYQWRGSWCSKRPLQGEKRGESDSCIHSLYLSCFFLLSSFSSLFDATCSMDSLLALRVSRVEPAVEDNLVQLVDMVKQIGRKSGNLTESQNRKMVVCSPSSTLTHYLMKQSPIPHSHILLISLILHLRTLPLAPHLFFHHPHSHLFVIAQRQAITTTKHN